VARARRTLRAQRVARERQERAFRRLLRPEIRTLLRAGKGEEAASQAAAVTATARHGSEPAPGRVALVGAGPGDPGLLTLQAIDLLAHADVVLHDALIPEGVLRFCGEDTLVVDAGKRHGGRGCSQDDIHARLVEFARRGLDVVRLKGGDPFVFGRGGEEVGALLAAGIDVLVVPGVSSALAAPAVAGIPVTMRGVASSVTIVSGHPRGAAERERDLSRLRRVAAASDTLVVLMPLISLRDIVATLSPVVGDGRMAALVSCATWDAQQTVVAPLGKLEHAAREAAITAPATLVVGDVVQLAHGAAPKLRGAAARATVLPA
jgi:uroporphyrin-III C-methyltransferase